MARRLFITSPANPRLRALRRVARRGSADVCLAEGARAVAAACDARVEILQLYVSYDLLFGKRERQLVDQVEASGAAIVEVDRSAFEASTAHIRSDGLLAVVRRPSTNLAGLDPPADSLVVVAVGIERPGNLGTIIRTACAAAVDGVIVADPRTDIYHPEVIRGSVGAVFHAHPVAARTSEVIAWLRARRFRTFATTPSGDVDYWHGNYRGGVAIVLGSERHGLPSAWLENADRRIAIPMMGAADSLNVAVAAGVVLFRAARSRTERRLRRPQPPQTSSQVDADAQPHPVDVPQSRHV